MLPLTFSTIQEASSTFVNWMMAAPLSFDVGSSFTLATAP